MSTRRGAAGGRAAGAPGEPAGGRGQRLAGPAADGRGGARTAEPSAAPGLPGPRRVPLLTPRHRAEALCFALAAPPPFTPPMAGEPGAALVRGRFGAATPAAMALRQAMRFDDPMVHSERTERVGDFDVTTL